MNTSILPEPDIGTWYLRYAARLRRVTRRIVANEYDAEDATQDAFLAAFLARARYRQDTDPYPWLARIAARKALTLAAAQRLRGNDGIQAVFRSAPSAEDEAVARDEARRVNRLVAAEVPVALHLIDDLSFRDVSARLGIPPATAATRIRRGKRRLRSLLLATTSNVLLATTSNDQRSKTA